MEYIGLRLGSPLTPARDNNRTGKQTDAYYTRVLTTNGAYEIRFAEVLQPRCNKAEPPCLISLEP